MREGPGSLLAQRPRPAEPTLDWALPSGIAAEIRRDAVLGALWSAGFLLDLVALHQHRRQLEAMLLLRSILPRAAALAAGGGIARLAVGMTEAGCRLTAPDQPAMRIAGLVADDAATAPGPVH